MIFCIYICICICTLDIFVFHIFAGTGGGYAWLSGSRYLQIILANIFNIPQHVEQNTILHCYQKDSYSVLNTLILLLESPCSLVRPFVTEKDRIVLANAYTMQTSSPMYGVRRAPRLLVLYISFLKISNCSCAEYWSSD